MAFFDKFKKTTRNAPKKVETSVAPKQSKEKAVGELMGDGKKPMAVRDEAASGIKKMPKGAILGTYAHRVLLKPIVSEKSARVHTMGQYIFKISPSANKIMVKKAVYEAYHVMPTEVKIIRIKGKEVRRGTVTGSRSAYKKAIVCMPKGVTLPIYEGV